MKRILKDNRLEIMFSEAPLGLSINDSLNGTMYEVNSAFANILKISIEDLKNINWMSITHPDDIEPGIALMKKLNSGEIDKFTLKKRFILPDNKLAYTNITVKSLGKDMNGRSIHLTMIEDITELRKKELELKKSEKKFREIFNSYVDVYYEADMNGRIEIISPSATLLTGYSLDELIGSVISEKYKFPDQRNVLLQKLKEKGKVNNFQTVIIAKNGNELLIETNIKWRKNSKQEITGIIGNARNIDDRAKLDATLKQLSEKEILLKEIHHRVKNNLQIISAIIQMQIRKSKGKETKYELNELKNRIKSISLIHEKLYQTVDLSSINFCNYIISLCEEILVLSEGIKADISYVIKEQNIFLSIDQAVPLGLIANELITNSIKYGLTDHSNKIIITIDLDFKNQMLFFEVKDYGPGLPTDFEKTRKSSLGFKMIDVLAKQLDSKININSENGTTISTKVKLT